MDLDRIDFIILRLLRKNNYTKFFRSMTLQEIMAVTNTTRPTTYRRMMKLRKKGYVEKGCKAIQADTFYLYKKGIELVDKKEI